MTLPLIDPWRRPARLWRSLAYVAVGIPVATVSFTVAVTLLATSVGLLVTLLFAIPTVWLLFTSSRVLTAVERSRAEALLDARWVDPVPPLEAATWLRRLWERVRSTPRWRAIAHHVLALPISAITTTLVATAWCGSLALVLLPLYVGALPGGTAKFHVFEISSSPAAFGAAAVGLVGLVLVAPWVTLAAAWAESAAARWFLGRAGDQELADQLRRTETRRSAAVDSAEAERRRIERDLHDGAQQRLVALAAELGAAREKLETDPEAGAAMVAGAHEEAKAALKDIRDLVRGIHPVILEDRGLDAALSAVVARSPIPVTLDVRVDPRPGATVESAAYFVVNEALTNVARHAQASRARVAIVRAGDRLVIEIHDDGIGGADASRGTGLQGLRERVTGLGGSLHVISPDGGPTTISVELPCAS